MQAPLTASCPIGQVRQNPAEPSQVEQDEAHAEEDMKISMWRSIAMAGAVIYLRWHAVIPPEIVAKVPLGQVSVHSFPFSTRPPKHCVH